MPFSLHLLLSLSLLQQPGCTEEQEGSMTCTVMHRLQLQLYQMVSHFRNLTKFGIKLTKLWISICPIQLTVNFFLNFKVYSITHLVIYIYIEQIAQRAQWYGRMGWFVWCLVRAQRCVLVVWRIILIFFLYLQRELVITHTVGRKNYAHEHKTNKSIQLHI